jgi:Flp pilus assembly pilin Flp
MLLALTALVSQVLDQAAGQVRSFLQREDGQDAFEYMLIIGGVSVAVVVAVALLATNVPGLRTATCAAIATITNYGTFSC